MAKADDLKAKLGMDGAPLQHIATAVPNIPDHEMVRRIGQGSYGEVWLARNAVGTWRAVKVVYRANFKDERPYEREFVGIQKYEPISRANEGLVDVLQLGRNDAEGCFYYVMELADDANPPGAGQGLLMSAATYTPKTLASEIRARGRLSVEECITLGLSLNLALGYLHRQGLLHRDVKPSNIIFVNGVPKLADIGLVTELAEAESFVGTEGFIPPEGPNSSQADLYALGKVLYEASMGKDRQEFPEPFSGLGLDADSKSLMELNAVLLRACAPDPKQRYQTAEEMMADLALLHSGESVKDKHALERRLKLTRRVAVAVVAVMVLGVVPYYFAIRESGRARVAANQEADARRESQAREREAREAEAQARAILEFIQRHVLAVARPTGEPNAMSRDVTVREALVHAERQIANTFSNQPLVEAQLRETMGVTFGFLGDVERAIPHLERALEVFRDKLGVNEIHTLASMNNLANLYDNIGQYEKALPLAEETVKVMRELYGTESRGTLVTMHGLALQYHSMGRDEEALALEKETLALRKSVLGFADSDTLSSMDGLATIYRSLGQLSNAVAIGEETVAIARTNLTPDDPMTLSAIGNLANTYQTAGRIKEALPLRKEALERRQRIFGPDAPQTLISMGNLATAYLADGDTEAAIALQEETLRLRQIKLPPKHPDVYYSMHNLASAYCQAKRYPEAIAMATRAVEGRRSLLAPDHPEMLKSMSLLGVCYGDAGQFSNAINWAEQTLALAEPKLGKDNPTTLEYLHRLAFAYYEAREWSNAIPRLREAMNRYKAQYGAAATATLTEMTRLGVAYAQAGEPNRSAGLWQEFAESQKSVPEADALAVAGTLAQNVAALLERHKFLEAEQPARVCLELRERLIPDDWTTFNSRSQFGGCLLGLKKYEGAESLVVSSYEGMKQREDKIPAAGKPRLKEALQRVVQLFEETNRSDRAVEWKKELEKLAEPANAAKQAG